jgi:hypothetical protein
MLAHSWHYQLGQWGRGLFRYRSGRLRDHDINMAVPRTANDDCAILIDCESSVL